MLKTIATILLCSSICLLADSFSLRLVVPEGTANSVKMTFTGKDGEETVFVANEEIVGEEHVAEAWVDFARKGNMFIGLNSEGAKRMTQATQKPWSAKMRLAVIINGKLDSASGSRTPLKDKFILSGLTTDTNTLNKLCRSLIGKK